MKEVTSYFEKKGFRVSNYLIDLNKLNKFKRLGYISIHVFKNPMIVINLLYLFLIILKLSYNIKNKLGLFFKSLRFYIKKDLLWTISKRKSDIFLWESEAFLLEDLDILNKDSIHLKNFFEFFFPNKDALVFYFHIDFDNFLNRILSHLQEKMGSQSFELSKKEKYVFFKSRQKGFNNVIEIVKKINFITFFEIDAIKAFQDNVRYIISIIERKLVKN